MVYDNAFDVNVRALYDGNGTKLYSTETITINPSVIKSGKSYKIYALFADKETDLTLNRECAVTLTTNGEGEILVETDGSNTSYYPQSYFEHSFTANEFSKSPEYDTIKIDLNDYVSGLATGGIDKIRVIIYEENTDEDDRIPYPEQPEETIINEDDSELKEIYEDANLYTLNEVYSSEVTNDEDGYLLSITAENFDEELSAGDILKVVLDTSNIETSNSVYNKSNFNLYDQNSDLVVGDTRNNIRIKDENIFYITVPENSSNISQISMSFTVEEVSGDLKVTLYKREPITDDDEQLLNIYEDEVLYDMNKLYNGTADYKTGSFTYTITKDTLGEAIKAGDVLKMVFDSTSISGSDKLYRDVIFTLYDDDNDEVLYEKRENVRLKDNNIFYLTVPDTLVGTANVMVNVVNMSASSGTQGLTLYRRDEIIAIEDDAGKVSEYETTGKIMDSTFSTQVPFENGSFYLKAESAYFRNSLSANDVLKVTVDTTGITTKYKVYSKVVFDVYDSSGNLAFTDTMKNVGIKDENIFFIDIPSDFSGTVGRVDLTFTVKDATGSVKLNAYKRESITGDDAEKDALYVDNRYFEWNDGLYQNGDATVTTSDYGTKYVINLTGDYDGHYLDQSNVSRIVVDTSSISGASTGTYDIDITLDYNNSNTQYVVKRENVEMDGENVFYITTMAAKSLSGTVTIEFPSIVTGLPTVKTYLRQSIYFTDDDESQADTYETSDYAMTKVDSVTANISVKDGYDLFNNFFIPETVIVANDVLKFTLDTTTLRTSYLGYYKDSYISLTDSSTGNIVKKSLENVYFDSTDKENIFYWKVPTSIRGQVSEVVFNLTINNEGVTTFEDDPVGEEIVCTCYKRCELIEDDTALMSTYEDADKYVMTTAKSYYSFANTTSKTGYSYFNPTFTPSINLVSGDVVKFVFDTSGFDNDRTYWTDSSYINFTTTGGKTYTRNIGNTIIREKGVFYYVLPSDMSGYISKVSIYLEIKGTENGTLMYYCYKRENINEDDTALKDTYEDEELYYMDEIGSSTATASYNSFSFAFLPLDDGYSISAGDVVKVVINNEDVTTDSTVMSLSLTAESKDDSATESASNVRLSDVNTFYVTIPDDFEGDIENLTTKVKINSSTGTMTCTVYKRESAPIAMLASGTLAIENIYSNVHNASQEFTFSETVPSGGVIQLKWDGSDTAFDVDNFSTFSLYVYDSSETMNYIITDVSNLSVKGDRMFFTTPVDTNKVKLMVRVTGTLSDTTKKYVNFTFIYNYLDATVRTGSTMILKSNGTHYTSCTDTSILAGYSSLASTQTDILKTCRLFRQRFAMSANYTDVDPTKAYCSVNPIDSNTYNIDLIEPVNTQVITQNSINYLYAYYYFTNDEMSQIANTLSGVAYYSIAIPTTRTSSITAPILFEGSTA